MKYVFHPEALTEYAEAVQYCADQRVEVTFLAYASGHSRSNAPIVKPSLPEWFGRSHCLLQRLSFS